MSSVTSRGSSRRPLLQASVLCWWYFSSPNPTLLEAHTSRDRLQHIATHVLYYNLLHARAHHRSSGCICVIHCVPPRAESDARDCGRSDRISEGATVLTTVCLQIGVAYDGPCRETAARSSSLSSMPRNGIRGHYQSHPDGEEPSSRAVVQSVGDFGQTPWPAKPSQILCQDPHSPGQCPAWR